MRGPVQLTKPRESTNPRDRGRLVRPATAADEAPWRKLWDGYCRFYGAVVPEAATAATWRRILDEQSPIHGLLVLSDGRVSGFCVYVLHGATWSPAPRCYLEDLFVAPAARGRGLGDALIRHVLDLAAAQGWYDVYWHTEAKNTVARRLYDRHAGAADGFVRYRINTANPG
ncbi:MAG: GNAT family N-acetyltransferase [Geminicoccaceae bacterium]|nr:MAG: GNAT family N-acetyltransferase [Geminicoccaceae bacterium]